VISFGALFLVVGKRSSELKKVGAGSTRRVLAEYTPEFLHSALTMSATVVVTGYCLWAFDRWRWVARHRSTIASSLRLTRGAARPGGSSFHGMPLG